MNYRVWCIVNIPHPAVFIPVADVESARKMIDQMAAWQLEDPNIDSNVFGLEFQNDIGGWQEWEDEDGYSITDIMDKEEE